MLKLNLIGSTDHPPLTTLLTVASRSNSLPLQWSFCFRVSVPRTVFYVLQRNNCLVVLSLILSLLHWNNIVDPNVCSVFVLTCNFHELCCAKLQKFAPKYLVKYIKPTVPNITYCTDDLLVCIQVGGKEGIYMRQNTRSCLQTTHWQMYRRTAVWWVSSVTSSTY